MNTYYVELDFVRAEIKETGISVSQGDYGRVKFSLAVKKDGEIITDAASADISFQLTNGYIVQGKLSGEAGLYDYVFQGNELQAPGKTIATVTLNYADGRTSSEAFSFEVRYNPLYSRLINAGSYIPELENIKAQAETYIEYLGGLIEQIKQEMGQTALTKESLANNFDVSEPGLKALDAAAGRTLDLAKMDKANIVNNGLTTEEGYAADARQLNPNIANTLAWQVAKTNSDIAQKADASNLENKTVVGTYNIPNITGVSTAPEQIAGGYHNVAKYSNGQCMYSMMVYVYTSAISNSIIGTISSQFSPKQDVNAYVYDVTGKRFLLVTIAPDGTIKLMTLEGTAIPESAVKARGSIVF